MENKIGINIGEICPICQRGKIIPAGGCNTCSACGSQLKCGL